MRGKRAHLSGVTLRISLLHLLLDLDLHHVLGRLAVLLAPHWAKQFHFLVGHFVQTLISINYSTVTTVP